MYKCLEIDIVRAVAQTTNITHVIVDIVKKKSLENVLKKKTVVAIIVDAIIVTLIVTTEV
jgi:hypothetical protein